MARPRLNRPTDAELQILAILWRQGARTIREIHIELKKLRGSGYNSALKLVQIMHDKGLVNKNATGYPQTFTAAVSRSATERLLVKDLLTRVFEGDAHRFGIHLDALSFKDVRAKKSA